MDVATLEQIKNDLLNGRILKHRRLLIAAGLFVFAFWTITIAGGYFLVTHAMDDNQASATRGVNTPTQVALLFSDHRPAELINSLVFLNRVKLEPTEGGEAYYACDDSSTRLIVVAHQPGAPSTESVANVMGTVRPVTATLLKKWKLSKEEQKLVKEQGIYLDAESLKVQKGPATVAKR